MENSGKESPPIISADELNAALDRFIKITAFFTRLPLPRMIATFALLTNPEQKHPDGTPWGDELRQMQRIMAGKLDFMLMALTEAAIYRETLKEWGKHYQKTELAKDN